MKLDIDLSPDILALMKREVLAAEKATTKAMGIAGNSLKSNWRAQVVSAGLGTRLSNTIRSKTYPQNRESLRAAALVWSKAPKILSAFERGVTIRNDGGGWLAIPLPAAGKGARGKRITVAEFERRTGQYLQYVKTKSGTHMLVATMRARSGKSGGFAKPSASALRTGRGLATVPVFILLRQVRLRKRLDLMRAANEAISSVPGLIVANWLEDRLA